MSTEALKITYRMVNSHVIRGTPSLVKPFIESLTDFSHKRMALDALKKVRDEEGFKEMYENLLELIETELGKELL